MARRRWRLISPPQGKKVDHISRLPDALIHHIFSFLPFKDVVRTSVLSKQWRFAWTSTPYIDVTFCSEDHSASISRTLRRCTATKIEKFHLNATDSGDYVSGDYVFRLLHHWNPFDPARKVEDVSLVSKRHYDFPEKLGDCRSLVSLRVSRCYVSENINLNWPSLEKLCIQDVSLENHMMMKILSGCPLLYSLKLQYSREDYNFRIDSRSLRKLAIEANCMCSLDISAPGLLSLRLSGSFFLHAHFKLKGVSSLAEAELNFSDAGVSFSDRISDPRHTSDRLVFLLKQLQHVPKITIRSWCIEVLSFAKRNLSSRWRNIVVYTTACKRELLGMAYLLQSSPLLERLVLCNPKMKKIKQKNKSSYQWLYDSGLDDFDQKQFWHSQKEFYCVANHLKSVEIVGFKFGNEKSKPLLALARFLLEEAVRLEKMIIDVELKISLRRLLIGSHDPWGFHDVIQLQEGCERASQNAEVTVNYRLNGLPYELYKQKHKHTGCIRFSFPKVFRAPISLGQNVNGVW